MHATSLGPFSPALLLAAASCLALHGCGGDDADPRPPVGDDPDGTGAIAGLYDASYEEFDAIDVLYVEIAPDGAWTEYDYEGDAFDGGENCYAVAAYRVEPLEGGRYRIVRAQGQGRDREAVLVRAGGFLRVTFADAGGGVDNSVDEFWPVLEGLSAVDFAPCDASG